MRHTVLRLLLIVALLVGGLLPGPPAVAQPADFSVPGGWFFGQAGPQVGTGYRVTDTNGIPFWSAFRDLGGVDGLGYPISQRFVLDGFVSQAMQRGILQWQPAEQRVALVNVLDRLHDAGLDGWLEACCSTPPQIDAGTFDAGKSPAQVRADRLALLAANPAIQATFLAATDPVSRFGLPTSPVVDFGTHFAVRLQRTVLQQWKEATPWAAPGQVTLANAGDLVRRAGLIPAWALIPDRVVQGQAVPPGPAEAAQLLAEAAERVRPSTVRVIALPSSSGTGFLFSDEGHVMTANHVVAGALGIVVVVPERGPLPATLIGRDPWTDVAVLQIQADGLPVVEAVEPTILVPGEPVVALGYGAPDVEQLDITSGRVLSLGGSAHPGSLLDHARFIFSDTALVPGYSGGPLVDAAGRVVGVNSAIVTSQRGESQGRSISIAMDTALPVARQLIERRLVQQAWLGITASDLNAEMAERYELTLHGGVLVVGIEPNSPAARSRLRAGEVILAVEGGPVRHVADLRSALARLRPGDTVVLRIIDANGVIRNEQLTLEAMP